MSGSAASAGRGAGEGAAQPTSAPLFRPEVLAARQAQWLGGIRIARPLS
jgi:hypothetical protein